MAWKNLPRLSDDSRGNPSKYKNRKLVIGGEIFDSRKEYRRWCDLIYLQQAGEITGLRRQVSFTIIPALREPSTEFFKRGKHKGEPKPGKLVERATHYVADFVYTDKDGNTVVEDCKGMRTKDYVLKRKLMYAVHGIRVKET